MGKYFQWRNLCRSLFLVLPESLHYNHCVKLSVRTVSENAITLEPKEIVTSLVFRKPAFANAKTKKDADQLRGNRDADQRLVCLFFAT